MSARSVLLIITLLMGSCAAGPRGAAVRPAPPGPLDLIRIMFGNFSALCPRDYEYCRGGRHSSSICCPFALGCCADVNGVATCCAEPPGAYRDDYAQPPPWEAREGGEVYEQAPPPEPPPESMCPSSDLTCSQGGRQVCCPRPNGCCVDKHGPYCCR